VLLVVRAGSTRRRDVRSSVQQLTSIAANLVGFVLNGPDWVAHAEGEYGYSQYYAAGE
jgi:Mrp family chromosome partitioning ATPase